VKTLARIRLTLLVAGVVAAAAGSIRVCWHGGLGLEFWFWLGACFCGELLWLRLPLGSATLSMASCFNFAALLVLPRDQAMVAAAASTVAAEMLVMRKPPLRAVYNAAQTVLAVGAASWTFLALSGGSRDLVSLVSHLQLLPFMASAVAYYVVNRSAVSMAVAWEQNLSPSAAWRRNFGNAYELLSSGAVFSLGALIATHESGVGMAGTLLVALPLVVACDGYRRYSARSEPSAPAEKEKRAA
jgi:hypothetical protein